MTFDMTVKRIFELAAEHGGTVSAEEIEADPTLSGDRSLTSAAGHMLAGGTNVSAEPNRDDAHWFPYRRLTFDRLAAPGKPDWRDDVRKAVSDALNNGSASIPATTVSPAEAASFLDRYLTDYAARGTVGYREEADGLHLYRSDDT
jgi:hypothetical protein